MNWLTVLAYFAVFFIGLAGCFKEAKIAWVTRNNMEEQLASSLGYSCEDS
jgi:hypothetical protein